jgi:hypothetical protein
MVDDLIRRARQRFLLNETLAQFAFAAAVGVAGFVLMLVLGTRFMGWWTLAVFAAVGIGIGSYRVWKKTPDSYATAVKLDENARLHDTLSTALYFSRHDASSTEFLGAQREQAEASAGRVRLEEAVPFVIPRTLYAMAALCVLASGLIALRFGIGNGLDLRAPITQFLLEDQAAVQDAKKHPGTIQRAQKKWEQEAESLLSKLGMGPKPGDPAPGDPDALEKALEQALENPPEASAKSEKGSSGADKGGQPKEGASDKDSPGDPLDNGEDSASDQTGAESKDSKAGDKGSKASSGKSANSGNKDSLLSRLKDAVSNMMSKPDENSSSQKGQQSAKSDSQDGAKGQQAKGDEQKSQSQADGQDGQPGSDGQSGQQSQGKLNSKADTKPGQGGSGIGSQDGSKDIKAAEQLKAMGKISEIIGQRAATVSGETSVEVESGSQKLRTAYSKTAAAHAETDGDVTRDEIPLALQSYVQQYFAEVRKNAAAKSAPAAPAAPPVP